MSKNRLLIFTRNPEFGRVKTRLAKTIGNQKALDVYVFLLNKTKEITENLPFDKAVYYSANIQKNDFWDVQKYQKKLQKGENLGVRMRNAFEESFAENYEKVIIIGSDLYDLTSEIITDAFSKLQKNEVVIGPAEDGGYYLLGMKKLHPKIFEHKKWGTDTVRRDTLLDLEKVSVHLLEELNDVDVFEDIEKHPAFVKFL